MACCARSRARARATASSTLTRTPHSCRPSMRRSTARNRVRERPSSAAARASLENIVKSFIGIAGPSRETCSTTRSWATAQADTHSRSFKRFSMAAALYRGRGASATAIQSPSPTATHRRAPTSGGPLGASDTAGSRALATTAYR